VTRDTLNSLDDGGLFPRLQQRYALRENPLDMETPFFPGAGRQQALESLRHLCGFGDMALVVTGAAGSGKTRLLAEFARHEVSRLDIHRIPTSALTSGQALARDLKKQARSAIPDNADAREAVLAYFRWSESRAGRGQRQVLLVDDADQGAPEVIQLLLAGFLTTERSMAAVPVFAGKESLYSVLSDLADASQLHRMTLSPLSEDDISAYLRPRIEHAGGSAKQLLSNARLKKIHALSEGRFSRLKQVTPGVWLDMVPGAAMPSVKWRLPSLASVRSLRWPALAVLLLGASFWFVSKQYDDVVRESEALAEPESEPVRKSITVGPETADVQPANQGVVERELPEPQQPDTVLPPVEEPEPEPEPSFVPENAEAFVPLAELRQREGWTLQLVAGQQEQTVLNVLARDPTNAKLSYTLGERQGGPWFMVVYGQYESKDQARAAGANLPSELGVGDPWVRSYDGF